MKRETVAIFPTRSRLCHVQSRLHRGTIPFESVNSPLSDTIDEVHGVSTYSARNRASQRRGSRNAESFGLKPWNTEGLIVDMSFQEEQIRAFVAITSRHIVLFIHLPFFSEKSFHRCNGGVVLREINGNSRNGQMSV